VQLFCTVSRLAPRLEGGGLIRQRIGDRRGVDIRETRLDIDGRKKRKCEENRLCMVIPLRPP